MKGVTRGGTQKMQVRLPGRRPKRVFLFLFFFQKGISSFPKINTGDDLRSFSLMRDSGMKMHTQVRREKNTST